MILLGLLLLAAALVFGIDLVVQNAFGVPDPVVFGNQLGVVSGRGLFVIGVFVGAGIVLGLALFVGGARRRGTRARDRRQERRAHREVAEDRAALEAENAELRRHLDEERGARAAEHTRPAVDDRYAGEARPAHEHHPVDEGQGRPAAEPGYAPGERGYEGEPTAAEAGPRGGRLTLRERLTHRDRGDDRYN